ncbi:MAG: protein-glutamate O-methyltransferase CheR [Acidimicrobiia bacterium]
MSAVSQADFQYVRELVYTSAALVVESGKGYLVESRLRPVAQAAGFKDVGAMVAKLRYEPYSRLHHEVVQAMTTNETSWFRDLHPYEALKSTVIPDLVRRRSVEQSITLWSAACSSGQEPYSVAMVLRDSFPELTNWRVSILASDLAESVVNKAREGRYSQLEVSRGLPPNLMARYFTNDGTQWVIKDELRKMVRFGVINLIGPWTEVPNVDIVMLRNVMIYFDIPTKQKILSRVKKIMRPDGYLFLGNAETTLNIDDSFVRVNPTRAGIYQLRSHVEGQAK